jgi:hypothetical protein
MMSVWEHELLFRGWAVVEPGSVASVSPCGNFPFLADLRKKIRIQNRLQNKKAHHRHAIFCKSG